MLGHEFHRLAQQSWTTRDFTLTGLREALADIITRFPVYRTYITADGVRPEDRRDLDWAISRARKETALVDHTVFDFLHAALSTDLVGTRGYERADVIATAMHFQQLTGPVMAKAMEDTAFYRYNRLVSSERGRRRAEPFRGQPRRLSSRPAAAAAAPSRLDARDRDPRPQARRGRARADRRPERAAAGMATPGSPLGPAQPPQAAGDRWPARAGPQRRVPALPDADRRLAARDRRAGASRRSPHSRSGSSPT